MTDQSLSDETIDADETDANATHDADRPPTPEEEAAAPTEADPEVSAAHQAANERGAAVKGEGQIEP